MKDERSSAIRHHTQVEHPPPRENRLTLFSLLLDESQVNAPLHSSSTLCSSSKSANLTVQENRQKAAKMLISVVIIFTICYIPVHAFNLFRLETQAIIHFNRIESFH